MSLIHSFIQGVAGWTKTPHPKPRKIDLNFSYHIINDNHSNAV